MLQGAVLRDTGRSCLLATALAYLAWASEQAKMRRIHYHKRPP